MLLLHRVFAHRFRSSLLAGLTVAALPMPALASIVPFEGVAKWTFSMEVTEYSNFGNTLSSGPMVGDSASLNTQSAYTGQADLDFYGPGRHDWSFRFSELSFERGGVNPLINTIFSSDMPPMDFDQTDLPGNMCGFIIDYCQGDLAQGGIYEAVRYSLRVNTLIPPDALQTIEDFSYPASFTFTESLIFRNSTDDSDLQFFTATGRSSAVPDDVAMSLPVPGAVVSLGSSLFVLASLVGVRRRRR